MRGEGADATTDQLDHSVRCIGTARYAIRCTRQTLDPSHLCYQHRDQPWTPEARAALQLDQPPSPQQPTTNRKHTHDQEQ